MNTARGTIAADFPIDACIDGSGLTLRNTLTVPIDLFLAGDVGSPVTVSVNHSIPAELTRLYYHDPLLMLPSDIVRIPVGPGRTTVSIKGTDAGGFYALATSLNTYIPAGSVKKAWGAITKMIAELSDDLAQYANCKVGKNWIGQLGCTVVLERNVTFAIGRGLGTALAKGAVALVLNTATFLRWAAAQPGAVAKILHHNRTVTFAPRTAQTGGPSTPHPSLGSGPTGNPPSGGSRPTAHLAQGPSVPSGYRYAVTLSGFAPHSSVSVTCFDSVSPGGFYTFMMRTDGSGGASTADQCYSADGPDHWVLASGVASNHVTWGSAPAPPATPPPSPRPPATHTEQQGHHGANTFTNYHNASGIGPRVEPASYVQVSCKVYDQYIKSVNPDGYWYRLAGSPWNNRYYAAANTFMNGDPWNGPYTHNTDFNVPNC